MDYETFYELESEPFSDIPDPELFYSGPEHTRALVKLLHVIKRGRALGLLTGNVGCGKTTILRKILSELDGDDNYEPGLIILTHPDFSPGWFIKKLGELLGFNFKDGNKTEMVIKITKELFERHDKGKKTVILVDEANNITNPEVIEEIRGLLNIELEGFRLITIILSGMYEIVDNIKDNKSLRQRISTVVDLSPLTLNSTKEYVKYRVEQAGSKRDIFSEDAYKMIFDMTDGIPRLINVICDNALLEGALLKKKDIGDSIIKRVGEELLLKD